MAEIHILTKYLEIPGLEKFNVYAANGGYLALQKALRTERQAVIDDVKASGLRGRGGAGFPTWIKWNGIPKNTDKPHYILANGDEGEPGTFKDRELMMRNPHQLVEGMIIAGYATLSASGYVYIRGEYTEPALSVRKAIDEAYAAGYLGKNIMGSGFDYDLYVHMGAGAYECGEEGALMSSLMGERGEPRLKFPHAPLPTISGAWDCPTVINNVETYMAVPPIISQGGAWYASMGTEKSCGTKMISVSGHVNSPGNYEIELGTPMSELLQIAGGVNGNFKAIIPGGSSVPILPAAKCEFTVDYEGIQAAGSMLGSGACMVLNDTACIVRFMQRTASFYAHESCGKCTPCREGTKWMSRILDRIVAGNGRDEDIPLLLDICDQIDGRSYCALGDAAAWPIRAGILNFRDEFEYYIKNGRSMVENACNRA